MIALGFALMAAATAPQAGHSAAPAKTVLFLKCDVEGASGPAHQLDMVFFDPKPNWAKGFNFFDPDRILPASVKPEVTNSWPALLQIELDSTNAGNSALIQLARDSAALGQARLNIAVINALGAAQPSYHGQCKLTEGAAAEAEFRGLMKQ